MTARTCDLFSSIRYRKETNEGLNLYTPVKLDILEEYGLWLVKRGFLDTRLQKTG